MSWDASKWEAMKTRARERWTDLSDQDFEGTHGSREEFVKRLEQRLGMAAADAERAADELADTVGENIGGGHGAEQRGDDPEDLARTVEQNI